MDWNHFFQFIVYFSMSPMIAIFYTLIRTLPDASRKISWNQIYSFSSLLETDNYISNTTYNKFIALDLNNDGKLSFSQFFKFVTQTYELWEPLYLFRVALIMRYFPNNMHLTILERRKNINSIKEYQLRNMNKLPSQSCNETLISLLCGIPNPNKYDYDNDTAGGAVIYNEIVNLFIKQFDPNYTSHRDGFKSNYLKLFKIFEVIYTIDQYFLLYYQADISKIKDRQRTTDQSKTLVSMYDSYLSESSCTHSTYMGLSGRKTTTKSILRSTSGVIAKSSRKTNVESTNNNGCVVSINNNVILSGGNGNEDNNDKLHKAVSQLSAISAASALHASLYPHLQQYHVQIHNNNNNNITSCTLPSPKHYLSTPVTNTAKDSGDCGCGSLLPGMIPGSTNSVESNHSTLNEDYQNIDSEIQV